MTAVVNDLAVSTDEHLDRDASCRSDCGAAGGYGGWGSSIAFPFSTPPEIVLESCLDFAPSIHHPGTHR